MKVNNQLLIALELICKSAKNTSCKPFQLNIEMETYIQIITFGAKATAN